MEVLLRVEVSRCSLICTAFTTGTDMEKTAQRNVCYWRLEHFSFRLKAHQKWNRIIKI